MPSQRRAFGATEPSRYQGLMTIETLHAHRRTILELATRHGARNVRVFGSIVRGDAQPNSDIDFLVEIESGRTLLDVIALEQDPRRAPRPTG
jgi:predicted nucleotidyltransferase